MARLTRPTLLVGGMGFIGLHTARRFLDQGQDVVLTYHAHRREPDFLQPDLGSRARVEQLDVLDAARVAEVIKQHAVDSVVYLAVPALAGVSPAAEFGTNSQGYLNVLEASRAAGVRRVTVTSSVAIYSNVTQRPWAENALVSTESTNPTEAYKKALEVLGLYFGQRTGLDVVMVRVAGIFGPLYHSMANLPSRLAHAAARGVAPDFSGLRYGPARADDANDACYVKDCAIGLHLVHTAPTLQHRVYNLGNGSPTRNADMVTALRAVVPEFTADLVDGGVYDPDRYMDLSRISSELGYAPEYGVAHGLADYVSWLRTHPQ